MTVRILNPEQVKEMFVQWSNFSKVCYDSHPKDLEVIGKHCLQSGHFSGSRSQYINFEITDCPRFLIDQLIRSEQGVCKNVQSFRYVNKENLEVEVPGEIADNDELCERYYKHIDMTRDLYEDIQSYIISKGLSKERANEQARYILPMSTYSAVTIGFDVEALIHYCNKRLCVRTEDIHRKLAIMIRDETLKILPFLKEYLVPQCEYLTWCPESHGCGAYPKKGEKNNA